MKHLFLTASIKSFNLSIKYFLFSDLKKQLPIYILTIFLLVPFYNFGQEKKPKVVLVLSGGGAKGIAHIPLLQTLDSLGIVPDLVIGTSMGSLVGALYSAGYSGDSIAAISDNANWNELLGGTISLTEVSVEEKSEFKKYLIDLDIKNGKPKVSSALINDQNLREFFSKLTFPVHDISNFNELPIPFISMATDIVNGKEVIMNKGSLALAMRASMSIPGIFRPVEYNGTLLIDGGVLNNFPTDVAKSMGADIIIGSDVSGGMEKKDKLDNLSSLLFQMGMLTSNLKNPENRKYCDILVDHLPYLTYSTGDFVKGKEIFQQGKIATKLQLNALVALAEQLKGYPKKVHELPYKEKVFTPDTISYTGISEANLKLVKDRANLKTNVTYTVPDIVEGINRAMGTNLFSQITTSYISTNGKTGIQINGLENSPNQIKGSLHYDTYRGVGLIINYTGRNILGEASRLIATIDIAEQPRFRFAYQKIFGGDKSWWWKSEVYGEGIKQEIFIDGNYVEDMRYRSIQFDNQLNKNLNSLKSYVGLGLNYQYTNIKPKTNPEFSDNTYSLDLYKFNTIELYAQYMHNSFNEVFFATRGTYFHTTMARSFMQNIDLTYYNEALPVIEGNTNGYTKLALNFEKRLPIKNKITGIVGATGSFIFQDQVKPEDVDFSEYGYAAKYNIGGNLLIPKKDSYVFPGLYEGELNASQFLKLNLGMQFNPLNKIYITPNFNIASVGFGTFNDYLDEAFTPNNDWQKHLDTSLLMSAGATISYNSFIGPVNFDMSWVNDINKVRLFFSVGFVFNPSFR